jgi:hypothetical protein
MPQLRPDGEKSGQRAKELEGEERAPISVKCHDGDAIK